MRPTRTHRTFSLNTLFERARRTSPVNVLRTVWIAAVVWYELGVFFWSVAQCTWPDRSFVYEEAAGKKGLIRHPAHVLLVADPQVLDENSYPERGRLLGLISQVIVDLNMRKGWRAIQRLLLTRNHRFGEDGDTVVFLGDMMDNGRSAYDDAEYLSYYSRFKSIFSTDASMKVYYIPGNHDIGLGTSRRFSPHSHSRYIKHFSPLNYKISISNHTLVMLDAPGLVEEDYRGSSTGQSFEHWSPPAGGVIDFVNKFASVGTEGPVVLFSHIPLFRPDTAPCGPLRERGTIRRGVGFGYQNTLGRQTSEYILHNVRPSVIFSGDDHDYCEYTHSIPLLSEGPEPKIEYTREVTVKSFSMAMGIRNPGFQLLSLADPNYITPGLPSYADAPCFLPDQLAIYLNFYLPLFLVSLCVLAVCTFRKSREQGRRGGSYNLDIDPGDVSSVQMSPESAYPGPLSSARMPSAASGGSRAAPTYRASSATFPAIPYTPDFAATPGGRPATPALLSAPPAGLDAIPGDVESGYLAHGDDDEDDESQYAERRVPSGAFYATSVGRTQHRKRRLARSWTFVLRGRRRRITIGVPPLLEQAIFRVIQLCCRGHVYERVLGGSGRDKDGRITARRVNGTRMFVGDLLRAVWPPVLTFALINLYMFC